MNIKSRFKADILLKKNYLMFFFLFNYIHSEHLNFFYVEKKVIAKLYWN